MKLRAKSVLALVNANMGVLLTCIIIQEQVARDSSICVYLIIIFIYFIVVLTDYIIILYINIISCLV